MATPAMQQQTISLEANKNSPLELRINTFNADGSVLDVSSGYTLQKVFAAGQSNFNPAFGADDITGSFSAAFDSTGLDLSATMAAINSLIGAQNQTQYNVWIWLSNDGGTTQSLLAKGTLQLHSITDGF
jgi:hypothetical protein